MELSLQQKGILHLKLTYFNQPNIVSLERELNELVKFLGSYKVMQDGVEDLERGFSVFNSKCNWSKYPSFLKMLKVKINLRVVSNLKEITLSYPT